MKESREKEVTLSGASVEPFRVLLQYIYTGQMALVGLKVRLGCGSVASGIQQLFFINERAQRAMRVLLWFSGKI